MRDALGTTVPSYLGKVFQRRQSLIGVARQLDELLGGMQIQANQPGGEKVDIGLCYAAINAVRQHLFRQAPYIACPFCEERGRMDAACACAGTGWLNEEETDRAYHAIGGVRRMLGLAKETRPVRHGRQATAPRRRGEQRDPPPSKGDRPADGEKVQPAAEETVSHDPRPTGALP